MVFRMLSMSARPSNALLCLERLETRCLLSGPSADQQYMLELINRMRTKPSQELQLLLASKDANVQTALDYFDVDRAELGRQWSELQPVAPLAWNDALARAALGHNQKMLAGNQQSHQLSGESSLLDRTNAAGYANSCFVGENIYAYTFGVDHSHAAFAIDWGSDAHGLQDPPGHRDNLMAGVYHEVGVAISPSAAGKTVGPQLITQDFGTRRDQTKPFLLGSVYDDRNKDGYYSPGEGLENVVITAVGKAGVFATSTLTAGGYQLNLPPGTYTMTASGGNAKLGVASLGNVVVAGDNVKRDFKRSAFVADTAGPTVRLSNFIASGGQTYGTFQVTYIDAGAVNRSSLSNGDVRITGPGGFAANGELVSADRAVNAPAITATYRFTAPAGFFDSADNGAYAVYLQAGQVNDTNANFAVARKLADVTVNVLPAVLTPAGVLVVNGTAANDVITLARAGSGLVAKVNSVAQTFTYASIKRIYVSGMAGNDTLSMARDIMGCTLDGGPGGDTIHGTDSTDTLQGADGDDLLYGNGGNDLFLSTAGRDRIFGGGGTDKALRDTLDGFDSIETLF